MAGASSSQYCLDDFEVGHALGKGQFGSVYKAVLKATGKLVALKCLQKQLLLRGGVVHQLRREVECQALLDHPHILHLLGYFHDETRAYLVLEYAAGGSVDKEQRRQGGQLAPDRCADIVSNVVDGMHYCHSIRTPWGEGIIHRDIKTENLLLSASGNVLISDFGWSAALSADQRRTTLCGTPEYVAPEILGGSRAHGTAADVWSVGILAFDLLTGHTPFAVRDPGSRELDSAATFQRIQEARVDASSFEGLQLPEDAADFIAMCLRHDPECRPTMGVLLRHPWLEGRLRPGAEGKNLAEAESLSGSPWLSPPASSEADAARSSSRTSPPASRPPTALFARVTATEPGVDAASPPAGAASSTLRRPNPPEDPSSTLGGTPTTLAVSRQFLPVAPVDRQGPNFGSPPVLQASAIAPAAGGAANAAVGAKKALPRRISAAVQRTQLAVTTSVLSPALVVPPVLRVVAQELGTSTVHAPPPLLPPPPQQQQQQQPSPSRCRVDSTPQETSGVCGERASPAPAPNLSAAPSLGDQSASRHPPTSAAAVRLAFSDSRSPPLRVLHSSTAANTEPGWQGLPSKPPGPLSPTFASPTLHLAAAAGGRLAQLSSPPLRSPLRPGLVRPSSQASGHATASAVVSKLPTIGGAARPTASALQRTAAHSMLSPPPLQRSRLPSALSKPLGESAAPGGRRAASVAPSRPGPGAAAPEGSRIPVRAAAARATSRPGGARDGQRGAAAQ